MPRGIGFAYAVSHNALYKGVPIDGNVTSVIKPFTPHRKMDRSLYLHSLTRKFRQCTYRYGSKLLNHRVMSMIAAMDSPTLPLAGIRVLDMTRVLAGVCRPWFSCKNDHTDILSSRTLRKFSETWGRHIESCRH